jgi:hypothetical protein
MNVQPTPEFARGYEALSKRARDEVDALLRALESIETIPDIPNLTAAYENLYVVALRRSRIFLAAGDAGGTTAIVLAVKDAKDRRGPLPIVVGVTGHVDLRPQDVPALERCVRDAFDELLRSYPQTPLLVVSPLAGGADQLVARVALTYQIPVVAPLPLEEIEYKTDFDAAQRREFLELRERAQCVFFVGYAEGNDAENVRLLPGEKSNPRRNAQYAKVGAYVARNSQILLALWDGRDPGREAGTAAIVRFKRTGRGAGFDPSLRPLDRPEFGPVWHISTPRLSDTSDLPRAPFTLQVLDPEPPGAPAADKEAADEEAADEPSSAEVTKRILQRMNRFNADALRIGTDDRTIETRVIRATAERLASRYQRLTFRVRNVLYLSAFVAAALFVLYAHEAHHQPWLLAADLLITVAALALYVYAARRELQNQHQDYRAIAEGLRVQEQWHTANLRETVADHYLRQYRGELDWIRNTIRVCRLLDDTASVDEPDEAALRASIQAVYDGWIAGPQGQLQYYGWRSAADERRERRSSALIRITGALSVLATFGVWYAYGVLQREREFIPGRAAGEPLTRIEDPVWIIGVIAITVTAVASGLLASYADKLAHGIHVKRYRRIRGIFAYAEQKLAELLRHHPFTRADYEQAQRVIFELGEEALMENAGWVILHRERPLEFPQGGG